MKYADDARPHKKKALLIALASFLLIPPFFAVALAQDAELIQTEEAFRIVMRYGRNDASSVGSFTVDPESIPLLRDYSAVTDEVLQNPPDSDWVSWGRTQDSLSFSNLNQINRENVANLQLAWHQEVTPGNNMPTPLIRDGVMFLYSAGDVVLAMDATNGELLWRYSHNGDVATSHKFGIALHDNKVLVPTSDKHMVALDARSGEVIWDHEIADSEFFDLRSAPTVAGGQVVQGMTGSRAPGGGFIVAIDLETGTESWRFYTIARPGEPGGNTWNNLPLEERTGGSVWQTASYDAELDLLYYGVAPTYDTAPLMYSIDVDGVTNDALYTNATLALRPATGELVWYYQHVANDQFDLDWIFERSILEMEVDGEMRKVVLTAGKPALFDALDAATGEYLFSVDAGLQNLFSSIDSVTGEKIANPDVFPSAEEVRTVCPYYSGGRNWPASSVNTNTGFVFVPMYEACMDTILDGTGVQLTSGLGTDSRLPPGTDGNAGRLQAIDLNNKEATWQYRHEVVPASASLATDGGLVFLGFMDKGFKAFDQVTGEILWETELGAIPAAFPITYSVDGKQYVAIVAGQLDLHTGTWLGLQSKFTGFVPGSQSPAALWVFALE